MKTAISIPDELFEQADQLAERMGQSRSELYRNALVRYLDSHSPDVIREALDRALESLEQTGDVLTRGAAVSVLKASEW